MFTRMKWRTGLQAMAGSFSFGSEMVFKLSWRPFPTLMSTAQNKSPAISWLMLPLFFLTAQVARAHSPFDSSTRMFVHDTTLELALTVGMDGGATLLKGAPDGAFQNRPVGPAFALSKDYASRFFEIASGGTALLPDRVEVRTDGLEFSIVLEYPRPAGSALAINAVYVATLPSSGKSAFVMTDELGNILATRILSQENHSFQLALPEAVAVTESNSPTSAMTPARAAVSIPQTNIPPAIAPAKVVPPPNTTLGFLDFLKLGIKHILTGYDHLLFLGGLLVVCRKVGPMLAIITCFTLAHSLTLALAALDLVQISPRLIEPLIAATIVFVGIENFRGAVNTKTRCGLALGFGLIHGFGFATALRESGLGGSGMALVKPLFAFNLGVETGQLAVAAIFLPLLFALRKIPWFERQGVKLVSAMVILLGGYWLLERLM
jgi:hypothetical protein